MMASGNSFLQRFTLFASGLVSRGSMGSGNVDEGFGAIVLATLLGAFCGLLCGLVLSHLVQYCYFLMGRQVSGHPWTIASVILGAALFAWWAAFGNGTEAGSLPPGEGVAEN